MHKKTVKIYVLPGGGIKFVGMTGTAGAPMAFGDRSELRKFSIKKNLCFVHMFLNKYVTTKRSRLKVFCRVVKRPSKNKSKMSLFW